MEKKKIKKRKSKDTELRIYEILGVREFREMAFKLEKIIHRKDKKKNKNYHVEDETKDNNDKEKIVKMVDFKKYLYFNGFIHVKNLIFGSIALGLMTVFHASLISIIILGTLLLKDAYCVMLQRYNWKRMKLTENRFNERERRKIDKIKETIDKDKIEEIIVKENINRQELIATLKAVRNTIRSCNNGIEEIGSSINAVPEMLLASMPKSKYDLEPKHYDLCESENNESGMKLTLRKNDQNE